MIITFCGQKGGTGKTTLSFLVAETLARAGKRVAIRDDDPQLSLAEIIEELQEKNRTEVELWDKEHAEAYDFTVIDTLPRLASQVLKNAIREADRLILPLKPSMTDIRATLPAVELVKQETSQDAKAFVVWNMVKPGTRISRQLGTLEKSIGLPTLKTTIPDRVQFSYAAFQGFQAISAEERNLIQKLVIEVIS